MDLFLESNLIQLILCFQVFNFIQFSWLENIFRKNFLAFLFFSGGIFLVLLRSQIEFYFVLDTLCILGTYILGLFWCVLDIS